MKITICDNYDELSDQTATRLLQLAENTPRPLICPASGDTPAGMYSRMIKRIAAKQTDISAWQFVGLDEWGGMNGDDEGSCRFHLNNQLFEPLQVEEKNIVFFNGRAANLQKECDSIDHFISQEQGIDIAVLGIGLNGHVGMNEPGDDMHLRSHVCVLAPKTIEVAQKYFSRQTILDKGITLGMKTLLEAKHLMLLISGQNKAAVAKQMLEGEINEQFPASLLRKHSNLQVYLDAGAAGLLRKQ